MPRGPYVLAAKHQSKFDLVFESVLVHRVQGRYPRYLMKPSLPRILEYLGGIVVNRSEDARNVNDIQILRNANNCLFDRVERYLRNGEIIGIHPEKHRKWRTIGAVAPHGISRIVEMQSRIGPIPIVPLCIEYKLPRVILRVGEPRTYDIFWAEQARELGKEIASLSRISFSA